MNRGILIKIVSFSNKCYNKLQLLTRHLCDCVLHTAQRLKRSFMNCNLIFNTIENANYIETCETPSCPINKDEVSL